MRTHASHTINGFSDRFAMMFVRATGALQRVHGMGSRASAKQGEHIQTAPLERLRLPAAFTRPPSTPISDTLHILQWRTQSMQQARLSLVACSSAIRLQSLHRTLNNGH